MLKGDRHQAYHLSVAQLQASVFLYLYKQHMYAIDLHLSSPTLNLEL